MALVTELDCWHETEESGPAIEQSFRIFARRGGWLRKILKLTIPRVAQRKRDCPCASALQFAVLTDPSKITAR